MPALSRSTWRTHSRIAAALLLFAAAGLLAASVATPALSAPRSRGRIAYATFAMG